MDLPKLIHREDYKIESEIEKLKEQRSKTAAKFNNLHSKLESYFDRPFTGEEIKAFVAIDKRANVRRFILQSVLEKMELGALPVKWENAEDFLKIPNYDHLIDGWSDVNEGDFDFYWNAKSKSFQAPAIDKENKEWIEKKHSIYATTEQELETYETVKMAAEFYNILLNHPHFSTPFSSIPNRLRAKLQHFSTGIGMSATNQVEIKFDTLFAHIKNGVR
jgi:hypothetical protein